MKSLPKLKKELEKHFNAYIRKRDSQDGYFTCISCLHKKPIDEMNAGHFYAVKGYDGLRFNEDNVHGECVYCNCYNESHLIGYTRNIEVKIGKDKLEALDLAAQKYKREGYKWSRIELQELINKYKNL